MSKNEMRAIRRDIINECLHAHVTSFKIIATWTRAKELIWFKRELKAYRHD